MKPTFAATPQHPLIATAFITLAVQVSRNEVLTQNPYWLAELKHRMLRSAIDNVLTTGELTEAFREMREDWPYPQESTSAELGGPAGTDDSGHDESRPSPSVDRAEVTSLDPQPGCDTEAETRSSVSSSREVL